MSKIIVQYHAVDFQNFIFFFLTIIRQLISQTLFFEKKQGWEILKRTKKINK